MFRAFDQRPTALAAALATAVASPRIWALFVRYGHFRLKTRGLRRAAQGSSTNDSQTTGYSADRGRARRVGVRRNAGTGGRRAGAPADTAVRPDTVGGP